MVVELKEGQEITVSCSRDAKFSDSVIPISSGSPQEIGLTAESEIFVGQYLFTGSENTSAFLTAKEARPAAYGRLNMV
jgi:pyruvate kinase